MPSSEMWHHVDLVRTHILDEYVTSIFKVERISELGTTLAITKMLVIAEVATSSLILSTLKFKPTHPSNVDSNHIQVVPHPQIHNSSNKMVLGETV
jgi:hypothetical protein